MLFSTNNPTPKILALSTALTQSVIFALILILFWLLDQSIFPFYFVFIVFTLQLFISYLIIFNALTKFIYEKVKVIYKSIHSLKAPKQAAKLKIDMSSPILEQVEKEVTEWAKDWTKEIKYLKRTEQFRKEFIDNVSHELKTPIFNMQGYLYTLQEGAIDEPEIRDKYLARAIDNVERIALIVQDLNQISKFETGGIQLDYKKFDILELVQEVLSDMEISAEKKQISLELKEHAHKSYFVSADKEMIRQVLTNLISNSIKYDTGKGISQEHLPRLFERFYRIDKGRSREEGGTGLGLSIVKHIIEAHNQTINVRSRLEVGSTFGFTLEKAQKN